MEKLSLSIECFSHSESLNKALPTPIRRALPSVRSCSTISTCLIPPVRITGVDAYILTKNITLPYL
jgi:hypothetical protein